MENYVSLTIFIVVFMSLFVLVAYVADVLACKLLKWLGVEGESYQKGVLEGHE